MLKRLFPKASDLDLLAIETAIWILVAAALGLLAGYWFT